VAIVAPADVERLVIALNKSDLTFIVVTSVLVGGFVGFILAMILASSRLS
jgi:uncharacterized membrane protein YheB (UPF0754 family)